MDFDRESLDREFPSRRVAVQMNHAAVCPLPARGASALAAYAERISTRGPLDYREWIAEADVVRRLAAALIGGGVDLDRPEHHLGAEPGRRWFPLAGRGLGRHHGQRIPVEPGPLARARAARRRHAPRPDARRGVHRGRRRGGLRRADPRRLRLGGVVPHRLPRADRGAGRFCHARGIVFGLDGIQAAGVTPLDVAGWGVDFLSADGHKWLLGPEGCGILYTAPELRARLAAPAGWTNLRRRHPTDYRVPELPEYVTDGTRFEVGALPTPGIYALAASLALLLEIGIETVARRVAETLDVLVRGLPGAGLTPVLFGERPQAGILAARPPEGVEARHVARRLEERGIVVTAREGFVRFSPHVGNDVDEAARVVAALSEPA